MNNNIKKVLEIPVLLMKYFVYGLIFTFYFLYQIFKYFFIGTGIIGYLILKPIIWILEKVFTPFLIIYRKVSKKFFKHKNINSSNKHSERNTIQKDVTENTASEDAQIEMIKKRNELKKKLLDAQFEAQKNAEYTRLYMAEIKRQQKIIKNYTKIRKDEQKALKNKLNKLSTEEYINENFTSEVRNQLAIQKLKENKKLNELIIDYEGEDAKVSDVKLLYEYIAMSPEGELVTDYVEAFSKVEVHSYLLSEGYTVYSIKTSPWIRFLHSWDIKNHTKFKIKDLIFFLTQLSTYLKAGITLVDGLKILSRQYKNKNYIKIIKSVVYNLTTGDSLSVAMTKQDVAFPPLLINMI